MATVANGVNVVVNGINTWADNVPTPALDHAVVKQGFYIVTKMVC